MVVPVTEHLTRSRVMVMAEAEAVEDMVETAEAADMATGNMPQVPITDTAEEVEVEAEDTVLQEVPEPVMLTGVVVVEVAEDTAHPEIPETGFMVAVEADIAIPDAEAVVFMRLEEPRMSRVETELS